LIAANADHRLSPALALSRAFSHGRGDPRHFPSLPLECGLTDFGAQTAIATPSPSPLLIDQLCFAFSLSLAGLGFQGLGFRGR